MNLDFALVGVGETVDPSAAQVSELAQELAGLAADPRAIFASARRGDAGALAVVDEVARRIALHLAPIAAVADVELVVLGGGIGANGDLLLEPEQAMKRVKKLEAEMYKHARNLEFEEAARLRDQIEKLRHQAFGVPDSRAG